MCPCLCLSVCVHVCVSQGGQNQKGDQSQPQDKDQTQGSAEATNMSQLWSGVFGITLLEGQDMPEYGQGNVYVRYRLGEQKYKSKVSLFLDLLVLLPPPFLFSSLICTCSPPSFLLLISSPSPFSPSLPHFLSLSLSFSVPPFLCPSLSLSRCVSVFYLHLGSLEHGRAAH